MAPVLICPDCGSVDIRGSDPKNLWERVYGFTGFKPYFCEECYLRFFAKVAPRAARGRGDLAQPAKVRSSGPTLRPVLVILAILVVLALGLGFGLLRTGKQAGQSAGADQGQTVSTTMDETGAPPAGPIPRPTVLTPIAKPTEIKPLDTQPFRQTTITTTKPQVTASTQPPARPTTPRTDTSSGRPGGNFTVQLAAFAKRPMADALAAKLAKQGIVCRVEAVVNPDGKLWYKVRSGRFATRSEAARHAGTVGQKAGIKAFVTKSGPAR